MEMIGFPILLAALLGFVFLTGDDDNSSDTDDGDGGDVLSGEGLQPSDGDDDGALTASDDIFNALGGDDRVEAGEGDDSVFGDIGDDTLFGQLGNDVLEGGAGDDELFGGFGDDTLTDEEGAIFMLGEGGDDVLRASNGAGRMFGGDGDDSILAVDADVTILGGAGEDLIGIIGGENAKAFGNEGDDVILTDDTTGYFVSGDAGADRIAGVGGRANGGDDDDVLASIGSFDEDAADESNGPRTALYGGEGDDQLWAVEGNTIMTGGEGADEFHNQNRATIEDFTPGEDTLLIDLIYAEEDETVDAGDYDIVLTEIDINGTPSTLVETRVSGGGADPLDVLNLNQTVWIKGVTPDQIGDSDISVSLVTAADNIAGFDAIFAPRA